MSEPLNRLRGEAPFDVIWTEGGTIPRIVNREGLFAVEYDIVDALNTALAAIPGEAEGLRAALPVVDSSCDCERCTSRTTEMYEVPGGCHNCGQRFTVRARKGDKVPLSVDCPACEVTVYGWRSLAASQDGGKA